MITYYEGFKVWYSKKGYPCIWINRKEIYLHVWVWERKNGNKPKGYDIHHKDLDKSNYLLNNLKVMLHSDHLRLHAGWIRENGAWIKKPCNKCNKVLLLKDFYYVKTRKIETALCKTCHNKAVTERNQRPENREKLKAYKRNYYREHYATTIKR
ncbi:MAG TPA: HNH endonuclease [Pricia antarctica]|uniref:HNH endonuclease n=1 Tax=Pricia antarctica TaxID=641691 RepID=A0A831QMA6_9FLAO|nr:HNH endonuclease [Pricia antarctica]